MDAAAFYSFATFQILVAFLLLWSITKWLLLFYKPARTKNLPPSPPKLPIIGNLHQLSSLPHRDLHRLARKHGPLMLLHFGRVPILIVSSAAAAREVLKTHDLAFSDRPELKVTGQLLYNHKDVFVARYGEQWRRLKSICVVQMLSSKRIQSFHSIMEEEAAVLVTRIRESPGAVNLSKMFTRITNDVICRSAFGQKFCEVENGDNLLFLLKEYLEILGTIWLGDFVPWLSWINRVKGLDARIARVAKEMDAFLEKMIQSLLGRPPEDTDNNGYRDKNRGNFVDILLDIYQNESSTGASIDRDNVKALILDVFIAGTDSSSTVLEWSMSELFRHPEIMKRLQDEVREVMKDKHDITYNDLEKMQYLKAVIKETLRSHTPVPLPARMTRNDVKVLGYDISAGTMVIANGWAIAMDPDTWDEPERFDPNRFISSSSSEFKGSEFDMIPFGAGRRSCPGNGFAMAITELVLANLVHKFDWRLPEEVKALDMSELPGSAIHRAVPLVAMAFAYVYETK